jgi:hypothetical protein
MGLAKRSRIIRDTYMMSKITFLILCGPLKFWVKPLFKNIFLSSTVDFGDKTPVLNIFYFV